MENKKKEIVKRMSGILDDNQIAELSNVLSEVLVEQTEKDNKTTKTDNAPKQIKQNKIYNWNRNKK